MAGCCEIFRMGKNSPVFFRDWGVFTYGDAIPSPCQTGCRVFVMVGYVDFRTFQPFKKSGTRIKDRLGMQLPPLLHELFHALFILHHR